MTNTPGDPLRTLPLRALHLAAGARMMPFAGWEMPLQYSGIVAEHEAVRTAAGLFDVSHMGRVVIRGRGAAQQLRSITTYDVTRLNVGETHYSLYCNEGGGIEDDVIFARPGDDRWLVVHNAANAEAGELRVREAAGDAVERTDTRPVILAIQGPRAVETASSILGRDVNLLPHRACAILNWNGAELLVSRTGYTGEDGLEVIAPPEAGAELWTALLGRGVVPAGLGARETLRLEAALPLHGHDITPQTNPYEAGLGWAVSLDDGPTFTGRAALERLAHDDPERRRVHVRLLERSVPREGYSLCDEAGVPVGALTSGAFSPTLRAGIGMGYVPTRFAAIGTRLGVQVRDRLVAAEVVRRPFYRRRGESD